jgi:hypothetical protein
MFQLRSYFRGTVHLDKKSSMKSCLEYVKRERTTVRETQVRSIIHWSQFKKSRFRRYKGTVGQIRFQTWIQFSAVKEMGHAHIHKVSIGIEVAVLLQLPFDWSICEKQVGYAVPVVAIFKAFHKFHAFSLWGAFHTRSPFPCSSSLCVREICLCTAEICTAEICAETVSVWPKYTPVSSCFS